MKSKRSKICSISSKTKKILLKRDGGCIFCRMTYHLPTECQCIFDAMHYIPKSRGGIGIAENAAIGCRYHHSMLDNGHQGRRSEMMGLFKEYLISLYPEWNEEDLYYSKW